MPTCIIGANQLFASPNFYFARVGVNYWLNDNITFTLGYAQMWLAPTVQGRHNYANENRIYEQAQVIFKLNKVIFLGRLRNEQRWQEKMGFVCRLVRKLYITLSIRIDLFIGLKQHINKHLSFDFGYMLLDQEKADGYHYDQNHTLRCFFYYMPDLRRGG